MWARCPFQPIPSPCRAGHPKLLGVLAGQACTGLGHRGGAQTPASCAAPHEWLWLCLGRRGQPCCGEVRAFGGQFCKKSSTSVSPEHLGEARTELRMGFMGSGLASPCGHHWASRTVLETVAVSPGPVLTALSHTSRAAQIVRPSRTHGSHTGARNVALAAPPRPCPRRSEFRDPRATGPGSCALSFLVPSRPFASRMKRGT